MNQEKIQRELELERLAIQIRDERATKNTTRSGLADTAGGKVLMKRAMDDGSLPFIDALNQWKETERSKRKRAAAFKFLDVLPTQTLVYLTCRTAINFLAKKNTKYRDFIRGLSKDVLHATGAALYEQKDSDGFKQLVRRLNWQPRTYTRVRLVEEVLRNECIEVTATTQEELAIGATLLELFCSSTELFEVVNIWQNRSHSIKVLSPTEKGEKWIKEAIEANKIATPYHLPMVVPPIPWTSLEDGGYLLQDIHPATLVRTKDGKTHEALRDADLSRVMEAVNAIQETPWQINRPVLEVWRQCVGKGMAGCSTLDEIEIPEKLPPEHPDFEQRQAERRDAFEGAKDNTSKRCVELQKLRMSDLLEHELEVFFPHNLDFRGRIYPLAGRGAINPQGDDSGKALLRFARGKQLGEDGLQWLYIHLQNCWGNDKVSLQARIEATEMNHDEYLSIGCDPFKNHKWMEADKPFCFLAACFELVALEDWCCIGGNEPETFVSHLPIALDGSCSGLQHFAGIMLDIPTARAVNVVQADPEKSADIYSMVADKVADMLEGREDEVARYWRALVSRDLVKQPVMTLTYGVTLIGMRNQIKEKCKKLVRKGKDEYKAGCLPEYSTFLADCIHEVIGEVASAAYHVMDWLGEAAKVKAKTVPTLDGALSWVTPLGLPVVQEYYDYNTQKYHVMVDGRELRFSQRIGPAQVRASKQKQGAAPNYVHSMDATHLMLTVLACKEHGIDSFAMIHDSFGTHAADTGVLFEVLRDEFAKLYQDDVLMDLYMRMPPEVREELPPPPTRGTLDLDSVRASEFFFA